MSHETACGAHNKIRFTILGLFTERGDTMAWTGENREKPVVIPCWMTDSYGEKVEHCYCAPINRFWLVEKMLKFYGVSTSLRQHRHIDECQK